MMYDKLKYGKELQKLLNCYKEPEELVNICVALEKKLEALNLKWSDGKITDEQQKETLKYVIDGMRDRGIDLTHLSFDFDVRGHAIKVTKEGWPYRDFGGQGVLVHESFL